MVERIGGGAVVGTPQLETIGSKDVASVLDQIKTDPGYKKNHENYEFRVISSGNQRHLVLKEQNWVGQVKEFLGIGSARRREERDAALAVLSNALGDEKADTMLGITGSRPSEAKASRAALAFVSDALKPPPADADLEKLSDFHNYAYKSHKGVNLGGGVCQGASITWLNTLHAEGLAAAKTLESPGRIQGILDLQVEVENGTVDTAFMKDSGHLHASTYDAFSAENFLVSGHQVTKAASKDQFAGWVNTHLTKPGDFAFINMQYDTGGGHASALYRGADDTIYFFNPDKGMYSCGTNSLDQLRDELYAQVGTRNCTLIPGEMAP